MSQASLPPFAAVVLEALAGHGLRPHTGTGVDVLRAQVSDLYRYEIRQLRGRLLAGDIPKASYADAVRALRLRYLLLSVPKDQWRVR
ncbi:hypothetical protein LuPra_03575 [Luteitalea pratensis]|uniref:Uncharacterized protein n=1 Tax=Luteitalea pratensis TaxID=1855912 RepID=A0A143PP42_LUTPR|nr:hypothetical protein [Luteitalea pratensis]AMY10345.1 hypothetical protein LuPra_03575 [Luteitalea pratensis]